MTSADKLFRRYAADYEAGNDPAAGEYVAQAEGADRPALELMIEQYLLKQAPVPEITAEDIARERASLRGEQIAATLAESTPADLRRMREKQDLELDQLAEKVLVSGAVDSPTEAETNKAADYLGRIERGEIARVSRSAWAAITGVLGASLPEPSSSPAYGMAFRLAPGAQVDEMASQAAEAEVLLNAYAMPSPRTWDRVDEFFLGEVDAQPG
jgi:hypothetical protein